MDDKGKDRLIIGGGTAAGAVPADKLDALRPTAGTAVEPVNLTPLRRYWHPVADAADVRDAPISVRLLNESIVIFRSGDRVSEFKDLCLHRGAKISMGKVSRRQHHLSLPRSRVRRRRTLRVHPVAAARSAEDSAPPSPDSLPLRDPLWP